MEKLADVNNVNGKVAIYRDNDNSYGVTATINGKYKSCYGMTEKTACKRYNKYCNELAQLYINKSF